MTHRKAASDILIVDDDPLITQLLQELLRDEGYFCRVACNGGGALTAVARAAPAVLLLDYYMADLTGGDVLTRLRAHGHIFPVAIITASPEVVWPLLDTHTVCIPKPFNIDALLNWVDQQFEVKA